MQKTQKLQAKNKKTYFYINACVTLYFLSQYPTLRYRQMPFFNPNLWVLDFMSYFIKRS